MIGRAVAKVKVVATNEVVATVKAYGKALQFCTNAAWDNRIRNNVKLHYIVYRELREAYKLPAQLAVACIKQACGIVKKAKSKPVVNKVSVRYNFPRSANLRGNVLVLRTLNERQEFKISVPECFEEYFSSWKVRESLLRIDKKGRAFFLFTFSREFDTASASVSPKVIGLDLGVNKLVVASDRRFFRSSSVKSVRNRFVYLRSRLQAKGTRSAKLLLKRLSGRETRFMAWHNHNVSKQLVSGMGVGDVLVMEELKGIRRNVGRRNNRWLHSWSFGQLQQFVTYKAQRKGVVVVKVPARGTSKTCHNCSSTDSSRHSGFFQCGGCGLHFDADLNAACNIARLYTRNLGKAAVNQPNVSGCEAQAPLLVNLKAELRGNAPPLAVNG